MARQRITEFRAKSILLTHLGLNYNGIQIDKSDSRKINALKDKNSFVFKVDEGIKKRMKKGLVELDVKKKELEQIWKDFKEDGYNRFLVEKFIPHDPSEEKFLSLERTRNGLSAYYSDQGGIDVEENKENIHFDILAGEKISEIAEFLQIPKDLLEKIKDAFDKFYFSFLEINPLVVTKNNYYFLDLAVEVDTTAQFFVKGRWTVDDFTYGEGKVKTIEEKNVEELKNQSQAAFRLDVLNQNGAIFMLLSGGGASLVLADEVYNLGFGKSLANYGEYSGNPNREETCTYAKNIISLLLKSKAKKKILIIGGAVANFTDVRTTFNGIIDSLKENLKKIKAENLKVYVRRGGPHQKEALQSIEQFLKQEGLFGFVAGPDLPLTEIIRKALTS